MPGHPDRRGRRPEGPGRRHRHGLPAHDGADCIVHLIRNSLDYAGWKDRKAVAAALRPIYTAASAQAAEQALQAFADGPWGQSTR